VHLISDSPAGAGSSQVANFIAIRKKGGIMRTIEESAVMAMDGTNSNLFSYLPYILQDLWEIGTSTELIIELVRKHSSDYSKLSILDLGCGKGPVSIKLAKEFKCHCFGIDAFNDFIYDAQRKAKEYNVDKYCLFEAGDIRTKISELKDFDIIILGGIGPVFGNYYSTLSTLSKCLKPNGLIIIDDGYIDDNSNYSHPLIQKKSEILKQISSANMKFIDETIVNQDELEEMDDFIFKNLKNRCNELIKKHPDKKDLFDEYIKKQEEENEILENKVICSTMVIKNNAHITNQFS
jgi:SAM-dependent methyltransferase